MQIGAMFVSVAMFALLGFVLVGGPMLLVDWLRQRRQALIDRQIELTEALDERLGPIVAPVVTKRLFGPWEVEIAAPFLRSGALARILAMVDENFSGERNGASSYRVILTAKDEPLRETDKRRSRRSTRWAGHPVTAS